MSDHYWLTKTQFERIEPYFPRSHDRRSYLGNTSNYWGLPVADIDINLIEKISQQKTWTIRVANDPPIQINDTVTLQQLRQFNDCMRAK